MTYQPTGRPPGRPKNNAAEPKQAAEVKPEVKTGGRHAKPETPPVMKAQAPMAPLPGHICPFCYPDGWPKAWSGIGCEHGIWTRRAF